MSYVYINRGIYPNQLVQDDPLDDNYAKGYSYDDYINGNPAPWIELDKETINLDVNGTQQTVNVTSNDSWTWAQVAARTVLRMMER